MIHPLTILPPYRPLPSLHPRGLAIAVAALAIGFNLPFPRLAVIFDYPGILRQPPEAILQALAAGGPSLILTWYAFALAALIFAPAAMAHALALNRTQTAAPLAMAPAVAGALAGVLQAMGADGAVFASLGIAGYLGLTLWMPGSARHLLR